MSPLDLDAGGTWVGLSQHGVFAGLTNLRPVESGEGSSDASGSSAENSRRSRGGVVMTALEAPSAKQAAGRLALLEKEAYNPFQLLVADGRDAFLCVYRDHAMILELEPGAHVVGNVEDERIAERLGGQAQVAAETEPARLMAPRFERGMEEFAGLVEADEPRSIKLARILERVEKLVSEPEADLFEGLARICREHVGAEGVENPFEATCVHIADRYGTRSSLLLELAEGDGSSRLWVTDGPPCERPFENRSSLLKDLGVRLGA